MSRNVLLKMGDLQVKHFLLLLLISFCAYSVHGQDQEVEVNFYGKKHKLNYDVTMLNYPMYESNDSKFYQYYYNYMDGLPYQFLLSDILKISAERKLNDYLYYQLIETVSNTILEQEKKQPNRVLFSWFLLAKSNFDVRLELFKRKLTLHVKTDEKVYGCQQARAPGGMLYVDLTYFDNDLNYDKYTPLRASYRPVTEGRPFDFTFTELPNVFDTSSIPMEIAFKYNQQDYKVPYRVDTNYIHFLNDYPEIGVAEHCVLPVSKACENTLIKWFKEQTQNFADEEACRFILSFVRTGFEHIDDEKKMGHGNRKIFALEESLYHQFTDTEERTIIFNTLVRKVVGQRAVVLSSMKNYNAAINIEKKIEHPIQYEEENFVVCDINDQDDKLGIGEFRNEAEARKRYKIYEIK